MTEEEEKERGFKVTDKRGWLDEETAGEPENEKPQGAEPERSRESNTTVDRETRPPEHQLPPMDFEHFVMALASSAMIQLGEAPDPAGGKKRIDLAGAQQTIDILSLLEEKTRGNLTPREESLLKDILADLRIQFVKAKSAKQ